MPDKPELQRHFGQPGNQRTGCGFPVPKWLAPVDLTTGMLLRSASAPLRSHEMSRAAAISRELEPGDLVLGDRGFCSYAHLALLIGRELHGVFRIHQKQIVDFTPGRPGTRGGSKDVPGRPRSRWVLSQGDADQVVVWCKPKKGPSWMAAEEYEALPEEIAVRELRYRVEAPGYRVREITLVKTLGDAATALTDLYFRRWQVEIDIRHLKITMKIDVLRCETVEGVLKELAMFGLVYNLVRPVMGESARLQGGDPDRAGRCGALVDRDRGGGPLGVGRQPLASRQSRAAGGETKAEAILTHDQAAIGAAQVVADEALLERLTIPGIIEAAWHADRM